HPQFNGRIQRPNGVGDLWSSLTWCVDELFVERLHLRENSLLFHLPKGQSHGFDVSAQSLLSREASFLQNRLQGDVVAIVLDEAILSGLPVVVAHAGREPTGQGALELADAELIDRIKRGGKYCLRGKGVERHGSAGLFTGNVFF